MTTLDNCNSREEIEAWLNATGNENGALTMTDFKAALARMEAITRAESAAPLRGAKAHNIMLLAAAVSGLEGYTAEFADISGRTQQYNKRLREHYVAQVRKAADLFIRPALASNLATATCPYGQQDCKGGGACTCGLPVATKESQL